MFNMYTTRDATVERDASDIQRSESQETNNKKAFKQPLRILTPVPKAVAGIVFGITGRDELYSTARDIVVKEEIYKDRYTKVFRCLTQLSRQPAELKVDDRGQMSNCHRQLEEQEVSFSQRLSLYWHPGLGRLFGSFEGEAGVNQVQEFGASGDSYNALRERDAEYSEEYVCLQVVLPLLQSLDFWHTNVMHRDVKLESLMLGSEYELKLGDLGLAFDFSSKLPKVHMGPLEYLAPEVASLRTAAEAEDTPLLPQQLRQYDEKADVWAVGVTAYELLVGHPPFKRPDPEAPTLLIDKGPLPGFLGFLTDDCVNFIRTRPSVAELLDHPWIQFHTSAPSNASLSEAAQDPLSTAVSQPGIATFTSPSQSLSPLMGTWKIRAFSTTDMEACSGMLVQGAAGSVTDTAPKREMLELCNELGPLSLVHAAIPTPEKEVEEETEGLQVGAEDITPRAPSRDERDVSPAAFLPQQMPHAMPADDLPPALLAPLLLRRPSSAGKSRFGWGQPCGRSSLSSFTGSLRRG